MTICMYQWYSNFAGKGGSILSQLLMYYSLWSLYTTYCLRWLPNNTIELMCGCKHTLASSWLHFPVWGGGGGGGGGGHDDYLPARNIKVEGGARRIRVNMWTNPGPTCPAPV